MTRSVGVHEAKTHLSRLLDEVAVGEEVVITRRGAPAARLIGVERTERRTFGMDRGRLRVPEDVDAPLPEDLLEAFEG